MNNKAALITGGADRIGRSIALTFAELGFDVALHYGQSKDKAEKTRDEIREKGVKCNLYQRNLEDIKQVESLIPDVSADMDLFFLVNNASVFYPSRLRTSNYNDLVKVFSINFFTPYILTQEFAKYVKEGHIINLLDAKVNRNHTEHFNYLLTKKILFSFTKMSAVELAPEIRVNGIAPGPILAPEDKGIDYLEIAGSKTPLKKPGSLFNITETIKYIVNNDYITGQIIYLDGGENL